MMMLDRKYYVGKKGTGGSGKKVPRDEGLADEILIDEKSFMKEQQYYDSFLTSKTYETKLPLQISFIINKGNMCRVK